MFVGSYIYIYISIYIYILLIYYLPAFTVTKKKKKKKKPRQEQEIKISRITARGKKEKNVIGQKERKGQPPHTSRKNQEMCSQLVKRKLKPVVNAAMPQLQECSTRVEPITKLT